MSTKTLEMNQEHSLTRWIKAHDLLTYFILTFLITFGCWFIGILTNEPTLFDLGLWGPAISAILTLMVAQGKPGIKELFSRILLWRVPIRWYLLIIFGWPAISILAALIHAQITDQPLVIRWDNWSGLQTWLFSAIVLGFWACEEIGWRGYALPRLLDRWNALSSSIILGILWALWHLPYYLGANGINPEFYALPIFTISASVLMTWVFKHTQGSIFVATFFHFWINIYDALQADKLTLADPGGEDMILYLLMAAAAVLVVVLYGYRNLTREQKSAKPIG